MQDTIDCNKINKIREERMQTQFYTGSVTTRAHVQYSSNPLEISTIFVKSITKSEPHRDNPSLVFRNPLQQETYSLLTNFIE
ncbi:hypothetical protein GmHk_05G013367 [Glycine max]|nr:hypothetical protein GmHk_05G013367 [Glycine max]